MPGDSGNYSCVPTMAEASSVNVHVINGKSYTNTTLNQSTNVKSQTKAYAQIKCEQYNHLLCPLIRFCFDNELTEPFKNRRS